MIAAAVAGGAEIVVSGDRHLLGMGQSRGHRAPRDSIPAAPAGATGACKIQRPDREARIEANRQDLT